MGASNRFILEQRRVIAALLRSGIEAATQKPGAGQKPVVPGPVLEETVTPPSKELIAAYVKHVGGDPSAYKGTIPPHLFPQWVFPLQTRTLRGLPYPLTKVLNGGFRPADAVVQLVQGLDESLPIVLTEHGSYETARIVASARGRLTPSTERKIDIALGMFEQHFTADAIAELLDVPPSPVVTPLMFESMLLERARSDRRRIVLPEGDDERILRAASSLLSRGAVELTLLGNEAQIRAKAAALSLDLDDARHRGAVQAARGVGHRRAGRRRHPLLRNGGRGPEVARRRPGSGGGPAPGHRRGGVLDQQRGGRGPAGRPPRGTAGRLVRRGLPGGRGHRGPGRGAVDPQRLLRHGDPGTDP